MKAKPPTMLISSILGICLILSILGYFGSELFLHKINSKLSEQPARKFLTLMDRGEYEQAFSMTSREFRAETNLDQLKQVWTLMGELGHEPYDVRYVRSEVIDDVLILGVEVKSTSQKYNYEVILKRKDSGDVKIHYFGKKPE